MPSHQHTLLLPLTLALAASSASAADCTCGYTINTTRAPDHALFTDLLESDFLHTYDFSPASARGMRWRPQTYDQRGAGGPCGMAKAAANVVANPLRRIWDWGGEEGVGGGDPGLQLWVRGEVVGEGLVPTAEVVSVREDVLYGEEASFFGCGMLLFAC